MSALSREQVLANLQSNLPEKVRGPKAFLCWRFGKLKPNGKRDKEPYYPKLNQKRHGTQGSPEDRQHLVVFADALHAYRKDGPSFDGIGIAALPDNPVSFIDLDHCLDPDTEELNDVAAELLKWGTYTEVSPSGRGLHLICDGKLGFDRKNHERGIEVFSAKGYVTLTGQVFGHKRPLRTLSATQVARLRTLVGETRPAPDATDAKDLTRSIPSPLAPQRDKVVEALGRIDPDCGYSEWIDIGMALHSGDPAPDSEGFQLWVRWSRKGEKFVHTSVEEMADKWRGFEPGGGLTLATLLKRAKAGDYAPAFDGSPMNVFAKFVSPPLDETDVPEVVGTYAQLYARASGIDVTALLLAGVVASAAMLDDGIQLRLPSVSFWQESARLWGALVGLPGSGKSPAYREMLKPAKRMHRELYERWASAPEAERPAQSQLYTSDSTTEALGEILAANPQGVLFATDELASWLGQHDAYRGGGSKDRGEWLRLYDGGQHQINRIKRGAILLVNWGASILSATTPAFLQKAAKDLPNDGLLQRFLLFSVRSMQHRDPSVTSGQMQFAADAYVERLRQLFYHEADGRVVRLSPEGRVAFETEEERLRALTKHTEEFGEALMAHVAKHAAMLARLSLTFHALEAVGHPADREVSAETVQRAASFMRKAFKHAHAIYGEIFAGRSPTELVRAIARSILASGMQTCNRRELTHACRAFRGASLDEQQAAMRILSDCGWLKPDGGEDFAYGAKWRINRKVHQLFGAEAEASRKRRAFVRAAIMGDA